MRDSMHILDVLRERGYEPQEDARPDEGWFDRHFGTEGRILRVVLTDEGAAELFGFDRYMCLEWDASFGASTPPPVFLAALDAAEREISGRAGPMHEHDGYAPHSHEVRADHLGVRQAAKETGR